MGTIDKLVQGTGESAGLDFCTTIQAVLTPQMGVQALPMGAFGPIPTGSVCQVLGRSSTAFKGLKTILVIVVSDYTGEIKVLVAAELGIVIIPEKARVAQLMLLPMFKSNNPFAKDLRENFGFGSTGETGIYQVAELDKCPFLELIIDGKIFPDLLDTRQMFQSYP